MQLIGSWLAGLLALGLVLGFHAGPANSARGNKRRGSHTVVELMGAGREVLVIDNLCSSKAARSRRAHHRSASSSSWYRRTSRLTLRWAPGTRHRPEYQDKVPLEMIEVQSGAYLGEDDIVRFEDSYGRG